MKFLKKNGNLLDLKTMLYSFNKKESFIYYPWCLSHLSLRVYYNKKFKLRTFKRKFYLVNFMISNSKKILSKKLKK